MRRNRKNSIRKERIVMIASSAFVLAALTMTGVYMKEKNVESKDDGYSVDFTELEDSVDNKYQEIAQNAQEQVQENIEVAQAEQNVTQDEVQTNMEDDLDYMPMEVGSGLVEIPGLTDGLYSQEDEIANVEIVAEEVAEENIEVSEDDADNATEEEQEASAQEVVVSTELNFSEDNGLIRPISGDILMNYSMDGSIYFETLDQYKYNPAVIFSAEAGDAVCACADAKVVDIYKDTEIGNVVVLDLGDGYQAIYGQLENVQVSVDSYVKAGDSIASVAAPTKYYSLEGCNLYFELTKDGVPVNPESMF